MSHFDTSISLSNIVTVLIFFWGLVRYIDKRITTFETVLKEHARTLVEHSNRMEKQDALLLNLVGDVARLVGRMEAESLRRSP